MNILELDSYKLSDAVKFNDRLNPKIFGSDEKMLPQVREHLLAIAADFQEFLGVSDYNLKDITISGSNAAYTYTPHSDIDLHLVADLPEADQSDVYRELFDAKKYQYNDQHDITIGGYDVELYVQNANQVHHSQGIYSVKDDRWVAVPKRRRPEVDDISVRSKYQDLGHRIEQAVKSGDFDTLTALINKIKDMRQAGLDTTGEFGPENLAFKILRTQNLIKALYDARNDAKDKKLSMDEARKKKKKKKVRYGFGGYWYPGYGYYAGQSNNDVADSGGGDGGGGDGGGGESVEEQATVKISNKKIPLQKVMQAFIAFTAKELKLKSLPRIVLRDMDFSQEQRTFGHYVDANKTIEVETRDRHVMDVMRTLAHELVHYRQHQQNANMPKSAGRTGSKYENEAHAVAGVVMRHFQNKYPKFFTAKVVDEDYSANQKPPGPETPPTMPAGTLRVDVSDVYDWYKIGQHISDMKGLGKHDFGAGPPSSIISFGDEDTEHKFIKDLEATGLDVTDIDPKDPKKRPGRKIKTDPTYNVDESPENKIKSKLASRWKNIKEGREEQLDEEDLFELKMSPSALEAWARSPDAEGIRAGFEAEMIFRNTNGNTDDYDPEPDYDYDERAYDLEGIVDFFANDDYGYGLFGRDQERFREQFDEMYYEWADQQMMSEFEENAEDLVRDYIKENEWDWEDKIRDALDQMDLSDADVDRIMKMHDLTTSQRTELETTGTDQQKADSITYNEAKDKAKDALYQATEDSVTAQDGIWDSALDEFRDNWQYPDVSEFLDDNGWRYMSDIASEFDLYWPYMSGAGNGGDRSIDYISELLYDVVKMEVVGSDSYHGTSRKENRWIIEPDGSLRSDDSTDSGLEIVSPPMPLLTTIEKLQQVIEWGNSDIADAYTNSSTGLHMGVSIPFKGGDVDYVKLMLFMGDEYVLEKFGRMSNHYCESALKKLRELSRSTSPDRQGKIAGAMELMQKNLIELAYKEIQGSIGESKYTSVHIQKGYIEFRSPGGDYLSMESRGEFADIKNTMLRFARAMYIAGRPDLERKEYGKKLYKLIAPQGGSDFELFARYSAGEMTADQLKTAWAQKIIDKEIPKPRGTRWKLFTADTHQPIQNSEFSGYTYDEAWRRAKENVMTASSDEAFDKAYTLVDMTPNGKWDVLEYSSSVSGMPYDYRVKATLEYKDRNDAVDEAHRIFPGEDFYIDVHPEFKTPEKPKLSARAELAKRIKEPRPQVKEPTSDVIKKDNAQDSAELQQQLDPQVRDTPTTVDQTPSTTDGATFIIYYNGTKYRQRANSAEEARTLLSARIGVERNLLWHIQPEPQDATQGMAT